MSHRLVCELDRSHPVALVRPRGVIDAYSAQTLRSAMLECLAEQPPAVIVDATGLAGADDAATAVLGAVVREGATWPAARIALSGAPAALVEGLTKAGVSSLLSTFPDFPSALAAARRWPVPPRVRERIAPTRNAPARARELVRDFCQRVGADGEVLPAELIASELVTNAVVHAGTPIELTLSLVDSVLQIAVRDGDPRPARLTGTTGETDTYGRGLMVVEALAYAWGNVMPQSGKVVWATVRGRRGTAESDSDRGVAGERDGK